jgi:plasmid stabilization system protein ParE
MTDATETAIPVLDWRRFAGGADILRHRLDGDTVVIIRVWHGREQRG